MSDLSERTQPASPRKRRTLRAKGEVAKSSLLGPAILLLAGTVVVNFGGASLSQWGGTMLRHELQAAAPDRLDIGTVAAHIRGLAVGSLRWLAPVALGVWLVCVLQGTLQTRFLFTWQPLAPRWSRLNPASGWRQIVSGGLVLRVAAIGLQLLAAGTIVWAVVTPDRLRDLDTAAARGIAPFGVVLGQSLVSVAFRLAAFATLLALLDYGWQIWKYERSIRMTPEEVREELRQSEGNPQTRAARRERQQSLAQAAQRPG